jgi:hypothetical protein
MRVSRSFLGILACSLTAALAAGPAQATAPAHAHHSLTAPSAPRETRGAAVQATPAPSPTISPSVTTGHVAPNGDYSCAEDTLCALAWDAKASKWKIFRLYRCHKYTLSDWTETGYYHDAQTGGVRSYFYGQAGKVVKSFKPDTAQHSQNWTPVWSIRNC